MTPTITAFERSPDRGRGLARDMRVRWALEEVGQPYDVRLVSFAAMKEPAHLALHPFGQIPTYEDGDLALFEIGRDRASISPSAMPACCRPTPNARARAITWMFAALNTVEPPIVELRAWRRSLERDKPWYARSACRCSRTASAPGWTSCPRGSATPTGSTARSAPAT